MEVSDKIIKYAAAAMFVLALIAGGALYFANRSHQADLVRLQNEIAKRDQTIEVQKGVYAKLTVQLDDLKGSIDTTSESGKKLADEVRKSKAELIAVNNALLKLKEQVAQGKGTQTEPTPGRLKVEFAQDFGYARVDGFTLTNPPEYQLRLSQGGTPLRLTLALTQQPDRSWKTLVASSDSNIAVDIGVSSVNPLALEPRWYEKLQLSLSFGVGHGVITGLGASYRLGAFEVGPGVWATTDGPSVYYGGSISWAPFMRK